MKCHLGSRLSVAVLLVFGLATISSVVHGQDGGHSQSGSRRTPSSALTRSAIAPRSPSSSGAHRARTASSPDTPLFLPAVSYPAKPGSGVAFVAVGDLNND